MAKQPISIVERHLEKGVLGLCAVVFLGAVVMFGVLTPNEIEIDSNRVGPDSVDRHLLDAAHRMRDRLRQASPQPVELEDPGPQFEAASRPIEYAGLSNEMPSPVPFLPRVPQSVGSIPRAGQIRVAHVIAPQQVKVTYNRASIRRIPTFVLNLDTQRKEPPESSPVFPTPVNWVTVSGLFDQQEQMAVFMKAGYAANRRNPYVVRVDLQRREKHPGGGYSDWIDVPAYLPIAPPNPPKVEIVTGVTGNPILAKETEETVGIYFGLIRSLQGDIMRPLFPEVVHGEGWLYPKYAEFDIRSADLELCTSKEAAGCDPRPYPHQRDIEAGVNTATLSLQVQIEGKLGEAQAAINAWDWDQAERIIRDEILNQEGIRREQEEKAQKKLAEARQGRLDEQANRIKRKEDGGDEDDPSTGPRSRYQLVWAHDAASAADGGAESGRTYQYRIRFQLYNRFVTSPAQLEDPAEAAQVLVAGEWSQPTADIHVEPDTRFFLTSGSATTGAKVTVYKWVEGVWVDHRFPVEIGQPIRGSSRKVVRVMDSGEEDRPLVDFDTGMTVVDIDYDYSYRAKKSHRGSFTIGPQQRTVALVYTDSQGRLQQRILDADRFSETYKSFGSKVFDPKSSGK